MDSQGAQDVVYCIKQEDTVATLKQNPKFSFTQSFKSTVQRFETLSEGKKADYVRSSAKHSSKPQQSTSKQKVAS